MMDLISIIIPVYNLEKYIERCLESVLEQSYRNLEIIVIDDSSEDNTGMICDRLAEKDSRIRVIHVPNSGVSAARNIGLETAQGDYIGFVDGDDYLNPKTYEYLYQQIIQGFDVAVCHMEGVEESEDHIAWPEFQGDGTLYTEAFILPRLVYDFDFISVVNKLYRREALKDVHFQNVCPEDADFNYRVFREGIKLNYSSFTGYAVRLRASSTMRKDPIPYTLNSRYSHCLFYCQYHKDHSTEASRAAALNRLFMQIVKTRWDYYDTEYRSQSLEASVRMRDMLIDEYKKNTGVSWGSRWMMELLFRSRFLYSVSTRMKGMLNGVIRRMS